MLGRPRMNKTSSRSHTIFRMVRHPARLHLASPDPSSALYQQVASPQLAAK